MEAFGQICGWITVGGLVLPVLLFFAVSLVEYIRWG